MKIIDPTTYDALTQHVLYLADNNLILGHRLSELCGHGPVLEQDIALTNIALDLIGQARLYYQYAAERIGQDVSEDDLAYFRSERQYYNLLVVERPNGHFGHTVARQYLYDSFHLSYLQSMMSSEDPRLAAIAAKAYKEVSYHHRFSSEWMIRLGEGTATSKFKMQEAIDALWIYSDEMFVINTAWEQEAIAINAVPDPTSLRDTITKSRQSTLSDAGLTVPKLQYYLYGGKLGRHSEYLGHILVELQYLQRAYPGLEW